MKLTTVSCFAISAALVFSPALYASHSQQKTIEVRHLGTTSFDQAQARSQTAPFAAHPREMRKPGPKPLLGAGSHSFNALKGMADGLAFRGFPVVGPDKSFLGFDGLDARDSVANGFTYEPPDQGMATDGKQVFETVNLAVRVFSTDGTPSIPPATINAFFNIPVTNPDKTVNGLFDPRVAYDWETRRWFFTVGEATTTAKGVPTGAAAIILAVSTTSDALGSYHVYSINGADAGFGDCPCFPDQPLFGLNTDGVYLNTNEYSNTTNAFQTTLIIALSKMDLISGSPIVTAAGFDGLTLAEGLAYSVQPALTAPGTSTSQNNGTEFFASTLDFFGIADNRLGVWALTNTESLESRVPNLNLLEKVILSEEYGTPTPFSAVQKAGHYPLGQSLKLPEETLATNDDRMQQSFYAKGKLYCALNTLLLDPSGATGPRTGAAWFAIAPDASLTTLSAKIDHQGYIGIEDGSVMFPAFAVNDSGDGIIGFSFSGTNYFPSTGYVNFDDGVVEPKVHRAGTGQAPEDGFTGYPPFSNGVARWGDYSAAMVAPDGHLWFAGEYIPNPFARPRLKFTNWGTFISRVQ
jgi:hypothetical protein